MSIITKQDLENAQKNANSWDKYWHGTDAEDVITYLNKRYPTHAKALKALMDNGGLRPFATEAELKTYVPTVPTMAAKALDTKKVWLWKNGTWIDTGLSELDQANKFTEQSVQNVKNDIELNVANTAGSNILNVIDADDNVTMYIDKSSRLFLSNAERAVQDYLHDVDLLSDKIKSESNRIENLAEFRDDSDNLYAYFDSQSELFLAKLDNSVQSLLNSDNLISKSNDYVHDRKSLITNDVQQYIVSCLSSGGVIAPIPFSQAQHNFTPPSDLINAKVEQGERLVIDTVYQNDDGVVHPHILEFRNGFLGYRYILGLTPYFMTQDKYENPCVYGSHDLENFELIDKFVQPFSERPAQEAVGQKVYNSDDFFTYDFFSGELLFCWRRSYENVNARHELWGRRTKNGLDWTHEQKIYDSKIYGEALLSPSIIFNFKTGLFELYTVEFTSATLSIKKMTSATLKNPKWIHEKYYQPKTGANIWHLDIRYIGNKIMCIAHDDAMTGNSTKNLYIGMYDEDSDEFIWSSKVITGEHYDPYKATFTPLLDLENNTIALQVLWSSRSGGDENMWKLYSSKSNSFELN